MKTIYNEIRRGLYDHLDGQSWLYVKFYSADIAQQDFEWKQAAKGRPLALGHNYEFAAAVRELVVKHKYAPDIITHKLRSEGAFTVSTRTLYRYIDLDYITGVSNKHLWEKRKKRSYNHIHKARRAPKGRSIEKRPADVLSRSAVGHWEMDSVIGKNIGVGESIITLTERFSRLEVLRKPRDKSSSSTVAVLRDLDKRYSFQSITVDNGSEFQDCYGMEYKKDGSKRTDVFYCHPYSSCERGSNERMNRMVRRFLPKGQSLKRVSQRKLKEIESWLNNYPRRSLGYKTPQQVYDENLSKVFCNYY